MKLIITEEQLSKIKHIYKTVEELNPVIPGFIRLYHNTDYGEEIKKNGLDPKKSRQIEYSGNFTWFSSEKLRYGSFGLYTIYVDFPLSMIDPNVDGTYEENKLEILNDTQYGCHFYISPEHITICEAPIFKSKLNGDVFGITQTIKPINRRSVEEFLSNSMIDINHENWKKYIIPLINHE